MFSIPSACSVGGNAALAGLATDVYLQQHRLHDVLAGGFLLYRQQQVLGIHRFNQIRRAHHLAYLVGLQVADEV